MALPLVGVCGVVARIDDARDAQTLQEVGVLGGVVPGSQGGTRAQAGEGQGGGQEGTRAGAGGRHHRKGEPEKHLPPQVEVIRDLIWSRKMGLDVILVGEIYRCSMVIL